MGELLRVFYTSEAVDSHGEHMDSIRQQSVANNARDDITGVILQHGGRYFQVLEGCKAQVDALMARVAADPRHKNIKIRMTDTVQQRLFDGWAMAQPLLSDEQIEVILRLLTSGNRDSVNVGLNFLKYWLAAQDADSTNQTGDGFSKPLSAKPLTQGHDRARTFSVIAFYLVIFLGVAADALLFLDDYAKGSQSAFRVLQAHFVAGLGLLLSTLVGNRWSLKWSTALFQITAFCSVAMHVFYAGYGIFAPSIPFLGVAILASIISDTPGRRAVVAVAGLLMIGLAAWASLWSPMTESFRQPVAYHHTVLASLLFPLVCLLIVDAHHNTVSSTQRFTAKALGELGDMVARLKRTLSARNYFFSAISHEIRTPMNGAISAVTLIQNPKANETIKARSFNALKLSLTNLNRLLNDLLDISKLESGKFELTEEPFDINEAVRSTVEFYAPAIQDAGNTLVLNVSPKSIVVRGDRQRFQQMLSNLLGNAVKFTRDGSITVSLSQQASSIGNESLWLCEVTDSGVGIPANEVGKLFQPFSQASQNGFSKTKGTGLGLAIVASLARQMGGDVGVRSVEGSGSTFWFSFNMARHGSAESGHPRVVSFEQ